MSSVVTPIMLHVPLEISLQLGGLYIYIYTRSSFSLFAPNCSSPKHSFAATSEESLLLDEFSTTVYCTKWQSLEPKSVYQVRFNKMCQC